MSKFNKYLVHDTYHIIQNLSIIHGSAEKEQIIIHVLKSGERNKRDYTEEEVVKCINHFETIRLIRQTSKDCYEVL